MIAAVTETQCGMSNLWLREGLNCRRECPNFGKIIARNAFKKIVVAEPYCFCDKKLLCVDKRDKPWDTFLPALQKNNKRRTQYMQSLMIIIDKIMSGWRPNNSKLIGLLK